MVVASNVSESKPDYERPVLVTPSIGTSGEGLFFGADPDEDRYVVNGAGEREHVDFTKILKQIEHFSEGLKVKPDRISQEVISSFRSGCTTHELRLETIRVAYNIPSYRNDYKTLACRLFIYDLHKQTPEKFSDAMKKLTDNGTLNDEYAGFVAAHADRLDAMIDNKRDELLTFLGLSTIHKIYLLKDNKGPIERPQYTWLRVAVGLCYPRVHKKECRCETCEPHQHDPEQAGGCPLCYERIVAKLEKSDKFLPKMTFGVPTEKDFTLIKKRYNELSQMEYIHASPTIFNIGTKCQQLSSCFLLIVDDDSIIGIYETNKKSALISQTGGGIGLSVSNVRPARSRIVTTNGKSNGLVPMLQTYEQTAIAIPYAEAYKGDDSDVSSLLIEILKEYGTTARYVDQGGGKRKGAFSVGIEPHHPDFLDVISMASPNGNAQRKAPELFYYIWMNDLFMERLEQSNKGQNRVIWSFINPKDVPELQDAYDEEYKRLYLKAEEEGKVWAQADIWKIWQVILTLNQEKGMPYCCNKDAVNRRNNHAHIGTIRGTNLCTEIMEVANKDEIAVCNLASVILIRCLDYDQKTGRYFVNYDKVVKQAGKLVRNLNRVIDKTRYPLKECAYSNLRHRPVGLGIIGEADVFHMLQISYDSLEAQEINHRIFEAMYYGALQASCKYAKKMDKPYETYNLETPKGKGSKVSRGILCFDECKRPSILNPKDFPPEQYFDSYNPDGSVKTYLDWASLRKEIATYGVYNSLFIAPMPTATTAKAIGCNESFEPYVTNSFTVETLAGKHEVVNPHLIKELKKNNLLTPEIYEKIRINQGSLANIPEIPQDLKHRFRTAWEIPMKMQIYMAHARGLFIDQSQSFNWWVAGENVKHLTSMYFLAWKLGLKTMHYYVYTNIQTKQLMVKQVQDEDRPTQKKRKLETDEQPEKKQKTIEEPIQNIVSNRKRKNEDSDDDPRNKRAHTQEETNPEDDEGCGFACKL